MTNTRWFLVALALTACTTEALKAPGEEEGAPIDGAFDSSRTVVDHEGMPFGRAVTAELTADEGLHAWAFTLDDAASVALRTESVGGGSWVDTVVYLYREGERGWGRAIAWNDDAPATLFSALSRELMAGRYRVVVKGYRSTSTGPFALVAECSGAGCEPDEGCLFGDTYREIQWSTRIVVTSRARWTSAEGLSTLERAQVVLAVHQSSHADVTTAEEAFDRVDQNEINHVELFDAVGARAFVALEYGAGDNSYGAIFAAGTTEVVASIHDGDLLDCVPSFETREM